MPRRSARTAIRPQEESLGAGGQSVLGQIDDQLDTMLENWRKTLQENLSDPTVKQSIGLLPDGQRSAVEGFLKSKKLPDKIDADLVQGIQAALSGLVAIPVRIPELLGDLGGGSAPCSVEEFRKRVDAFLERITRGKEVSKVRLVIEVGDGNGQGASEANNEPRQ